MVFRWYGTEKKLFLTLIMFFSLSISGCTEPNVINVSAAASLQEVFDQLALDFEQANPGIKVNMNYASSGILRTQIQQGAPVDVYASASMDYMDDLLVVFNEGSVEQVASPEEVFNHPANMSVAELVGVRNIFSGVIEDSDKAANATLVRTEGSTCIADYCNFQKGGNDTLVHPARTCDGP
ncbi:MAG: extracellular solute-binding protein [ANME-2 cluster archaeon]|nr:extracellular solute-binding protein [ANME-2 cluster archaeon]